MNVIEGSEGWGIVVDRLVDWMTSRMSGGILYVAGESRRGVGMCCRLR
jgi:hypothetical protein